MSIPVGELKFGEVDAKNELFQQSRYGSTVFLNAFQVPPRVDIDELLSGSRFLFLDKRDAARLHYFFTLDTDYRRAAQQRIPFYLRADLAKQSVSEYR